MEHAALASDDNGIDMVAAITVQLTNSRPYEMINEVALFPLME